MKRAFDLVLVLVTAPLWIPLLLGVALVLRVRIGSKVLFGQRRPGLHGRIFTLIKFRTMTDARDPDGAPRPDAERLTSVGRWLRATSLDELPELWNVIRGDMSLVGPRPLLPEYLPLYSAEQARRHDVRPGITGWAQINGRNAITWEEKLALDAWYVEHRSFGLDARILWRTLGQVVKRHGVSHDAHETMPRFTGSGGRDG